MDYNKIFLKEANPTPIGGQAVMEGVMMQGPDRAAIAIRLPEGEIYLKTRKLKRKGKARKIPVIRGIVAFFNSLVSGMGTLMESADILEKYIPEDEIEEETKFEKYINNKFGEKKAWSILLYAAVIFSIVISVVVFVLFPTVAVSWLGKYISSSIALNLVEGIFRLAIFVGYILMISKMEEIKRLFQYHGAEHKTIHCFENGLDMTPENAQQFYTLHPRCGTSFLMFVMIISLIVFSLLGWPNLLMRVISRIVFIPLIAGLSYEVLKWAGRSDNIIVKILSTPGLLLQKITTNEPTDEMLEVAIVSMKAVLADADAEDINGIVDINAVPVQKHKELLEINNNTVEGAIRTGRSRLENIENGKNEAVDLFRYIMSYTYSDIIIKAAQEIEEDKLKEYYGLIDKRLSGIPLQYITGVQEFMGRPFKVNGNVLIPRLDTEILVDKVLGIIKGRELKNPSVLDMCTGSGAIGISIASEITGAEVDLADVSSKAINIAIENAMINNTLDNCQFLIGDLYKAVPKGNRYDIIISNPPYIESGEIPKLNREVKDFEPMLALDGGEDGLDMYRRIIEDVDKYLTKDGVLAMEIGYNQKENIEKLFKEKGIFDHYEILKDLNGKDRIALAEKKGENK